MRNVLAIAGETTESVDELWRRKVIPSFSKVDGKRRLLELYRQMRPTTVDGIPRKKVYPVEDRRVARVLRKILRGLAYVEYDLGPVLDDQVVVCEMPAAVPSALWDIMDSGHRDPDIVAYRHLALGLDIHSGWFLMFYGRTRFMGVVFRTQDIASTFLE